MVTISGPTDKQSPSNGVFDNGSMTLTIRGISETVPYGKFSTNVSLASAFAAKFTQDCHSDVMGHATGATITFETRDPAVSIGSVVAIYSWDSQDFGTASFALNVPANAPPVFNPTISCVPAIVTSGQNVSCAVTLLAGATSSVSFSVNGSAWVTALPDATGNAVINAPLTSTDTVPDVDTISYSYLGDSYPEDINLHPGDPNIPSAFGTAQVSVNPAGVQTTSRNSIYSFSIADQYGNSGYQPNSNIANYSDQVNGAWALGYDSLNRLTSSANGSQWGCWAYDAFGNMQTQGISSQQFSNATTCQAQSGAVTLQNTLHYNNANQIDPASNDASTWLDASKNTHTGSPQYDAAGEMTNDLLNTYLYNPQGQVCAVQTGPGAYVGYLYDAEGHRVAKGTQPSLTCDASSLQVTAVYFIGPDGETMTELGSTGWVRTEVSAAGMHLATYKPDGVHYPITDWLGTKRMTMNPLLGTRTGWRRRARRGRTATSSTAIRRWMPRHGTSPAKNGIAKAG